MNIYMHNELLSTDVLLGANGTLQVWCLVVIRHYVALQIREILILSVFIVLRFANVA